MSEDTVRLVLLVVNAILNLATLVYVHHSHREAHQVDQRAQVHRAMEESRWQDEKPART